MSQEDMMHDVSSKHAKLEMPVRAQFVTGFFCVLASAQDSVLVLCSLFVDMVEECLYHLEFIN